MVDPAAMRYVVSNTAVAHITIGDAPHGKALCGVTYAAETAAVVTQAVGYRECLRCRRKADRGSG